VWEAKMVTEEKEAEESILHIRVRPLSHISSLPVLCRKSTKATSTSSRRSSSLMWRKPLSRSTWS
jgi:hypothetical protein